VIFCTGGTGMIYGRSTMSMICTGAAAGSLFQQGVGFANGEFMQIHPTAIAGEDKNRLISEAVRGEGGRLWTYKDGKRWYFLEEWYPKYKNLVPRDIASRAIFKVVRELKLGVEGKDVVYLDISHIDRKILEKKLWGILEIYEKFMNEDPSKVPMRVFPSMHYSMGGIYIDSKQMSNIPGILAAGECEYQYHGANRLGANSLLSCLQGGLAAARAAVQYVEGLKSTAEEASSKWFDQQVKKEEARNDEILRMKGKENPYKLWEEMGNTMTDNVTVVRYNKNLEATDQKLLEIMDRTKNINVNDVSKWANQSMVFTRQLFNMLQLARVITLGALARNESRGAHYKPDFPDRDDANWLKTTVAKYTPKGPELSYEPVDTSLLKPRERKY
jgi:succinate dehydrogenase / fumarate reductase flavoprotein subunit